MRRTDRSRILAIHAIMGHGGTTAKSYALRVDAAGRVLIPAPVRRRHGLEPGAVVIVSETASGKIALTPQSAAVRAAQAQFGRLRQPDELWSEELIRERRAAAKREYGG